MPGLYQRRGMPRLYKNGKMDQKKRLLGLIGFPLGHSWSPVWFNNKFAREGITNLEYRLFPLSKIEEFPFLLRNEQELIGVNVTIPYKEKIINYLDELDETARLIGAVNTIKVERKNGKILTKGYNTDAPGFLQTLPDRMAANMALIIGTGGGAKSVAHVLTGKNIPFLFVSRINKGPGIISFDDLTAELIRNHLLIINTTPLGMFPESDKFPPIPYHYLSADHFLYDLIYNPEVTEFMKRGQKMAAQITNGIQMLINQAELSYQIFMDNSTRLTVQSF